MIPEPASFIMEAMSAVGAQATTVAKPAEFHLTPHAISYDNYHYWVLQYQATDVVPPPEDFIVKTDAVNKSGGNGHTNYNHSGQIAIDAGYEAFEGTVTRLYVGRDNSWSVDVSLGNSTHRFSNGTHWSWTTPLGHQQESITWGMGSYRCSQVVVTVEVHCRATKRADDVWKADTHARLLNARKARMQEYEEKLAALKLQAGVVIQGK